MSPSGSPRSAWSPQSSSGLRVSLRLPGVGLWVSLSLGVWLRVQPHGVWGSVPWRAGEQHSPAALVPVPGCSGLAAGPHARHGAHLTAAPSSAQSTAHPAALIAAGAELSSPYGFPSHTSPRWGCAGHELEDRFPKEKQVWVPRSPFAAISAGCQSHISSSEAGGCAWGRCGAQPSAAPGPTALPAPPRFAALVSKETQSKKSRNSKGSLFALLFFFFFPFLFLFQRNKNIGTFCVVSTFFWHFCVSLAACYCPLATLRRFCCSKRNQRKNLNFQVLPAIVFCFCLCY